VFSSSLYQLKCSQANKIKLKSYSPTKENIRRSRFRLWKNNEADKTSDPTQSNPILSMDESNPCPTLRNH